MGKWALMNSREASMNSIHGLNNDERVRKAFGLHDELWSLTIIVSAADPENDLDPS
ncbi:hypothetical protein PC118_g22564 [Phytophthora cactorum]|uniref:Uncharacterized protein n=1 Tax=Phytophthora cactorum TaxID=29920 RepID=A0A8T1EWH7_9STRA|nr:hypothetical protein PC118_g22564 [Phytophthora cactorum]